jgi:hypothetical protein
VSVSVRTVFVAACVCLLDAGSWSVAFAADGPARSDGAPAVATPARRELGELVTDRPDITESSAVVGRGVWQVESGLSLERDGDGRDAERGLAAPMALVRLGLSDRLELRLGADGYVSTQALVAGAPRSSGMSDVNVGFKYVLAHQDRLGVDLAVIPFVSIPSGSDAFSSGGYDPTLKLTWARDLPRGFGLSGNVNVSSLTEGERFTSREVMVSLGHELAGGWAGFWEAYNASAIERGGSAAWLVDSGVTHAVGANAQVDLSIGRGLTSAAPNWFVGIGVSMRGFFRR